LSNKENGQFIRFVLKIYRYNLLVSIFFDCPSGDAIFYCAVTTSDNMGKKCNLLLLFMGLMLINPVIVEANAEPPFPLGVEWKSDPFGTAGWVCDTVIVNDIFIGRNNAGLRRYDINTGSVIWYKELGKTETIWGPETGFTQTHTYRENRDPIIINQDKFYTRKTNNLIMCVSLPDCEEIWTGPEGVKEYIQVGDKIVTRTDTTLSCLDADTGTTNWSTNDLIHHLTADENHIYGINYNILKALHHDGSHAWSYNFGFVLNWVIKSRLVHGDYLFLYSSNGTMGFNLQNHQPVWYSPYKGTLHIAGDKLIIDNEQTVALNPETGEVLWQNPRDLDIECIVDNTIICKNDNQLVYISGSSGETIYERIFKKRIRELTYADDKLYATFQYSYTNNYEYARLSYMDPLTIDELIPPELESTNPYTTSTNRIEIKGNSPNPGTLLNIYWEYNLLNTTTTDPSGDYMAWITTPDPQIGTYTILVEDPYHEQEPSTNYEIVTPNAPSELEGRVIHILSEIPDYFETPTLIVNPSTTGNKPLDCQPALISDLQAHTYFEYLIPDLTKIQDNNLINIDQDGSLLTDPGYFTICISGPLVNPVVKYYESSSTGILDRSQVEAWLTQDFIEARRLNGETIEDTYRIWHDIGPYEDLFVIEIFEDSENRVVLVMYGFGPMGTVASGCYLENVILENLGDFTSSWIVVSWNDSNQNNQVDSPILGDSYEVVASGNQYWN